MIDQVELLDTVSEAEKDAIFNYRRKYLPTQQVLNGGKYLQ